MELPFNFDLETLKSLGGIGFLVGLYKLFKKSREDSMSFSEKELVAYKESYEMLKKSLDELTVLASAGTSNLKWIKNLDDELIYLSPSFEKFLVSLGINPNEVVNSTEAAIFKAYPALMELLKKTEQETLRSSKQYSIKTEIATEAGLVKFILREISDKKDEIVLVTKMHVIHNEE